MKTRNALWALMLLPVLFTLTTTEGYCQDADMLGLRTGVYADGADGFVGAEFLRPIYKRLYFNPNIEYVFVDEGAAATFNLDFHYDFLMRGKTFTWAGAGLGLLYSNPEGPAESDTDPAANILFGIGYNAGSWIPYAQAKVIASDDSDFVIGGGIRFVLE